ncbi:MAG: class I SAM-dependent methyltransferase [Cyclobacteriaceae bacterium]|nr:class I SAM-dependent methyltransferase [Cyclobacteriaceae bacterium]
MGITNHCAAFLKHAGKSGVDFSATVMLGRQQLYVSTKTLTRLLPYAEHDKIISSKYAEPFFEALGAKRVDSLDYSDYEQATLIHDLNKPLPDRFKGSYTVVFDGGTLEHVFNFPVAIKNCMDLLHVGGHFISITPCNNQCGHGLYQFSPELFYSVFSMHHGFYVRSMHLAADVNKSKREWYEVVSPMQVKSRVVFQNSYPTYLMVIAQKQADFSGELKVYQSDYQEIWAGTGETQTSGLLVRLYKTMVPDFIRARIYRLRHSRRKTVTEGLGSVDPSHFKRVIIDGDGN